MIRLLTNRTTYETLVRYLLGLAMLPYGLTKIMRTQFVVLPFHEWAKPLGDISGVTLTWAFLGYSPWFTVLLGLLETIPAVLLLFRKTKLLGALLLFPVILNVFLINVALDLWSGTQKISAVLLAMNMVLLLFHYPLLRTTFIRMLSQASLAKGKGPLEILVNIVLVGVVVGLSMDQLTDYINQRNLLTGDWYNQKPDYWIVKDSVQHYQAFSRSDTDERDYTKYYFQPYQGSYKVLPDQSEPVYGRYELDPQRRVLTIYEGNDSSNVARGSYQMINENTLVWKVNNRGKLWLLRRSL